MENLNRLDKERIFHDNRFGGDDGARRGAHKYYSANKKLDSRYEEIISTLCKDKVLLEYGCGTGSGSRKWINMGAKLYGIDISPEAIKKADNTINKHSKVAEYYVMDAEATTFNDQTFDVIVGTGILHHLDLKRSCKELSRILKEDGHIVFSEPLGHNPIINLYRNLTPKMRTEDEHPLKVKDLELIKSYFETTKNEYFSLFTLLVVPFRKTFLYRPLYSILSAIDDLFFLVPFFRRFAWMVIVHSHTPKKNI